MTHPIRVLLCHPDGSRPTVRPDKVYYLEADGDETLARQRSADALMDVRPIGQLVPLLTPFGLLRFHRSYAVNVGKVRKVRPRDGGGWEVKLDPPVNRALPVSASRVAEMWRASGEESA